MWELVFDCEECYCGPQMCQHHTRKVQLVQLAFEKDLSRKCQNEWKETVTGRFSSKTCLQVLQVSSVFEHQLVCVCVCVCALSTYVKVFWLTLEKTISTVKLIHGRSLDEFECLCLHWVYFRDLWCTVNCLVWMLFESLYYVHSGDQCNWACWTIVLPCRAVASACAKVAVPCVECIKPVA